MRPEEDAHVGGGDCSPADAEDLSGEADDYDQEEGEEEEEADEVDEEDDHANPQAPQHGRTRDIGAHGAQAADESDLRGSSGGAGEIADVRETLSNVASGLAEQLSSITEEMNKIRQELYGESGLGGIATELERLKVGGLGAGLEALAGSRGQRSGRGLASRAEDGDGDGASAGSSEARRRRSPEERERELEELRRRFQERRLSRQAAESPGVSFGEKLLLLALVLVCLYVASPFFRTSVKKALGSLLFGTDSLEEGDGYEFEE